MKIRDIQIDGFGVWSGLSVDSLPPSMVVFYGPNEAGKTTLMQFLRAMFYGFTPDRRSRYLPPVYGGKPGGVIRVSGPGGGYEIARRSQLDAETTTGQLTVTSSDGVSQGQHRLSSLLGNIDERIFSNVFAIGLRELQELSTLNDTAAADELYKLSSGMDRVSLVDVIRKLKNARSQVVGASSEAGQMQAIMLRRDKLREELEQLNNRTRRWGELASVRKSQQKEIQELRTRVETLTLEAKTIELSLQVRDPWKQRFALRESTKLLNARLDLPDDAASRLQQLHQEIDEKKAILDDLRIKRREVRDAATALPLNKGVMALATRIDVANEQGPWIAALQKQILQLNNQVEKSREQLIIDAKRLGLDDEDQIALLNDKRLANLPDLTPQAISQLSGPAKDVRTHSITLKQSKVQIEHAKKECDRLSEKVKGTLELRKQTDLQAALSGQQSMIANLRKLHQIEERHDKLVKHRKELEGEAVNLASNEALPMDRIGVLAIPFVLGGSLFLAGLGCMMDLAFTNLSQSVALFMCVFGMMLLMGWYMYLQVDQRTTNSDLTDCEGQLDGLLSQIRKTQQERTEMMKLLPETGGSVEQRMRDAENELATLETLLPISHNLQAAQQRLQSATREANHSNTSLKSARAQWKRTLQNLGLAESLSPKSIRMMAEGYESLVQSRRRLKTHEDELEQRKLELSSIDAKVDSLLRQILAMNGSKASVDKLRSVKPASSLQADLQSVQSRESLRAQQTGNGNRSEIKNRPAPVISASQEDNGYDTTDGPMEKLSQLQTIVASQQQFIARKRELRGEYDELIRKHKACRKAMDRLSRTRDALLAELAVENSDQLTQLLAKKKEHEKLNRDIVERDSRIQAILGGAVPYETVARLLDNAQSSGELEKRWESILQNIAQSEQRVSQLLERQGETQQEMKTIAGDRRLLEIKTELSVLDRQVELTAEHWRTLATTSTMLQRVCEVYETERQPETLREASSFLKQLTDGKYIRVWTPLGKNALRVENENGQDLPLEVLSRGTREAVFIALRLSLAAAYSRRGVMLPLVLDDVLVNFDAERAYHAAKVLRDFSQLGHQTVFFTCHEHIMRMFHEIDVQVRVLPAQGQSGEAKIYAPPINATFAQPVEDTHFEYEEVEATAEPEPEIEEIEYVAVAEPEVVEEQAEPAILIEEIVESPVLEEVVTEEWIEPAKPKRRVRSQPKPYQETVVEAIQPLPELIAEPVGHFWYETDIEETATDEIALLDEINANWLSSENVPGIAWEWDTMAIQSSPARENLDQRSQTKNVELVNPNNAGPWWKA